MRLAYNETKQTTIAQNVRSAISFKDRLVGLLNRSSLPSNEGLWIQPCRSIHTFFMRFSIDVAFIDSNGKIAKIYRELKPYRHTPIVKNAVGVLELAGGALHHSQTQEGDTIIWKEA